MKDTTRSLLIVALLALATHPAAQEIDPFAPGAPYTGPPPSIAFLFEWIEVEQADLHQFLSVERIALDGSALRLRVAKLIDDGRANLIEAIAVHAESGKRGAAESIEELFYQTEYDPPGFTGIGFGGIGAQINEISAMPITIETQNVGYTVEHDCVLNGNGRVDLNVFARKVEFRGMRPHGRDESRLLVPDFFTTDVNTQCQLQSGRPRLLSTHQLPEPINRDRKDPRILVFVRAEIRENGVAGAGHQNKGRNDIRDCAFLLEIIETDRKRFIELTNRQDPSAMRSALLADLAGGRADLVDTAVVCGAIGSRFQMKSVLEIIYPTEFDPAEVWQDGRITPPAPVALETRYAGSTIEFEVIASDEKNIRSRLEFDLVSHTGETAHGRGIQKVAMPIFSTKRIKTILSLSSGEDTFLSAFTPATPDDPERKDPIWVLFVRGEPIKPEGK